ncbi:UDP-glucose--hexose-1-phosphate uridylyltransferase [uncultured Allobaculum sp.]|uniref:UDP-glucose--hexose-1-phosphate uridylyltransferase n=1 Tax=Allobaculum sp. TaxID=1872463 RepID=UPI00258B00B9|nr:UDP-glucose--hexose-1-phosphate uridylyltransferase [uncultured Allobaculum sp.]
MADQSILKLVEYGVQTGLLPESERTYAANLLLDLMHQDALDQTAYTPDGSEISLPEVLNNLLDTAAERSIIEDSITYRDLFDAKLMNALLPRPAQIQETFEKLYEESPKAATDYFYKLSQDSNYIRRDRIARDERWSADSPYGEIELSINLSKPEKDPKAIAAAKSAPQSAYPKCQLCMENEGYAGRVNHPGRTNHRIIPITVNNSRWGFQYSPYVYYNEHCIVFNGEHTPMAINHDTFVKLFDFIDLFPHYFLGSNADLPIVGGSILSHDHFQGGNHEFPMAKAEIEEEVTIPGFEDLKAGIVKWPMAVIRLRGTDRTRVITAADHILDTWRGYSDESAGILANANGEPHNTITPIARKRDGEYELDLVLRCNITSEEHPMGVFHPHAQWHHIKKENIGLIEVMGLAVLPARLKKEMSDLKKAMLNGEDLRANPELEKHADWAEEIMKKYDTINAENIDQIIHDEIGIVFTHVLEDAGVYKTDAEGRKAFRRFIDAL